MLTLLINWFRSQYAIASQNQLSEVEPLLALIHVFNPHGYPLIRIKYNPSMPHLTSFLFCTGPFEKRRVI
jgi:hypothetical protein